jgi:hypothetical protein
MNKLMIVTASNKSHMLQGVAKFAVLMSKAHPAHPALIVSGTTASVLLPISNVGERATVAAMTPSAIEARAMLRTITRYNRLIHIEVRSFRVLSDAPSLRVKMCRRGL